MKRCNRCVLSQDFPGITFDEQGVCNYCRAYENFEYKNRLENYSLLKKLFNQRLDDIRDKHEYDCLIGISGGKDSSYVLHMLKNHYNLNVLAYTFDNGFLSDYAKNNIRNLVKDVGVDHLFYKPKWEFHKEVYQKMTYLRGIPCKGCSLGAYGTSFKFAVEKNIPLVFHGRTPAQLFREYHPNSIDPTLPFIESNLSEYTREKQITTLKEVQKRLQNLLGDKEDIENTLAEKMMKKFFPDISTLMKAERIPEFIGYFLYHKYDEEKIKNTLETELNWRRPEHDKTLSHDDCLIHNAVEYLRYTKKGYLLIEPELSVLIRQGKITRKEALQRIEKERETIAEPKQSMNILCSSLNLNCTALK